MGGCKWKDPNLKFVAGMLWNFVVFLPNSQFWGLIELFIKYSQLGLLGEYWKLGTKMKSQDENSREVNKRGMRNQTSFVT
jgi:hypothetical protein